MYSFIQYHFCTEVPPHRAAQDFYPTLTTHYLAVPSHHTTIPVPYFAAHHLDGTLLYYAMPALRCSTWPYNASTLPFCTSHYQHIAWLCQYLTSLYSTNPPHYIKQPCNTIPSLYSTIPALYTTSLCKTFASPNLAIPLPNYYCTLLYGTIPMLNT